MLVLQHEAADAALTFLGESHLAVSLGEFAIAVYGGRFGTAAGLLRFALHTVGLGETLLRANNPKNVITSVANSVASVGFAVSGSVDWVIALPLAAGFLSGVGWRRWSHAESQLPPCASVSRPAGFSSPCTCGRRLPDGRGSDRDSWGRRGLVGAPATVPPLRVGRGLLGGVRRAVPGRRATSRSCNPGVREAAAAPPERGRADARFTARSPRKLCSSRASAAGETGWERCWTVTGSSMSALSHSAASSEASFGLVAKGFSFITCTPASAHAVTTWCGTAPMTKSGRTC